jgi:hypothetical protein
VLPFACLALLSFVAFLGVAAIAGALHLIGVTRSALGIAEQRTQIRLAEHSAMRTRSTTWRLCGSGQPRFSCHHQNRMRDGEGASYQPDGSTLSHAYINEFTASSEGLRLVKAFTRIARPAVRQHIVMLVQEIAGSAAE